MTRTENDFVSLLAEDKGNPEFADYAAMLMKGGRDREALDVCLAGLSANPSCHSGRLVLARVFFRLKFVPFAIREISYLCNELPESNSMKRLLEKISGVAVSASQVVTPKGQVETIAEAEFDMDAIEDIDIEDETGK